VSDDWKVDTGLTQKGSYMGAGYGMGGSPMVDTPVYRRPIYTQADVNMLYGKPKPMVTAIQQALYQLNYMSSSATGNYDRTTQDAYKKALEDANRNGETFQEMYNRLMSGGGPGGSGSGPGGSGSGASSGPHTSVSTSVSLTSRAGAQQILTQQLATELGRAPMPNEVSRFLKSLNRQERADPTVSTTVSTANRSSTTTKQSSVDPGAEGADFAKTAAPGERKDFKEFQYMNVVAQMLGGN
jgi:hypothetical protein